MGGLSLGRGTELDFCHPTTGVRVSKVLGRWKCRVLKISNIRWICYCSSFHKRRESKSAKMPTLWTCSQQRSSMLTKPVHSHFKKDSSSKSVLHLSLFKFHWKMIGKKSTCSPVILSNLKPLVFVDTKASPLLLVGWSRCSPWCVVSLSLSQFGGQDSQVRGRFHPENVGDGLFFGVWCF